MKAIFVGGPEHGRSKDVPADQKEIYVANVSDGTRARYYRHMDAAVANRPPFEAYFVLHGIDEAERTRLLQEAITNG